MRDEDNLKLAKLLCACLGEWIDKTKFPLTLDLYINSIKPDLTAFISGEGTSLFNDPNEFKIYFDMIKGITESSTVLKDNYPFHKALHGNLIRLVRCVEFLTRTEIIGETGSKNPSQNLQQELLQSITKFNAYDFTKTSCDLFALGLARTPKLFSKESLRRLSHSGSESTESLGNDSSSETTTNCSLGSDSHSSGGESKPDPSESSNSIDVNDILPESRNTPPLLKEARGPMATALAKYKPEVRSLEIKKSLYEKFITSYQEGPKKSNMKRTLDGFQAGSVNEQVLKEAISRGRNFMGIFGDSLSGKTFIAEVAHNESTITSMLDTALRSHVKRQVIDLFRLIETRTALGHDRSVNAFINSLINSDKVVKQCLQALQAMPPIKKETEKILQMANRPIEIKDGVILTTDISQMDHDPMKYSDILIEKIKQEIEVLNTPQPTPPGPARP